MFTSRQTEGRGSWGSIWKQAGRGMDPPKECLQPGEQTSVSGQKKAVSRRATGRTGAQMRVLLMQGATSDGLETYFGGRANWSTQAAIIPTGVAWAHLPQPPLTFLLTRKLAATASP